MFCSCYATVDLFKRQRRIGSRSGHRPFSTVHTRPVTSVGSAHGPMLPYLTCRIRLDQVFSDWIGVWVKNHVSYPSREYYSMYSPITLVGSDRVDHEQDILNAISLVNVAKSRMQQLRSHDWGNFLKKVTSFCITHGVEVPAMDGAYVPYGKSARYARARNQTNDDHFRREVYIGVIDQISQELDNRFDEINMEMLSCMSSFSPSHSFASFDAQKVRRLAEFYPNDFSNNNLLQLELQLDNYIDDVQRDERFQGLENIVDLSVKLV
jgi:hypothetical protein